MLPTARKWMVTGEKSVWAEMQRVRGGETFLARRSRHGGRRLRTGAVVSIPRRVEPQIA